MNRYMMTLLILIGAAVSAQAQDVTAYYPPVFEGQIDFQGSRFALKDDSDFFVGERAYPMKPNYVIDTERRPGKYNYSTAVAQKLYLADLSRTGDSDFVKYVKSLNDLAGYAEIHNETDALEYLRLPSSVFGIWFIPNRIVELFCVRAEDSAGIDESVQWATEQECLEFGFAPPQIEVIPQGSMTPPDDGLKDKKRQLKAERDELREKRNELKKELKELNKELRKGGRDGEDEDDDDDRDKGKGGKKKDRDDDGDDRGEIEQEIIRLTAELERVEARLAEIEAALKTLDRPLNWYRITRTVDIAKEPIALWRVTELVGPDGQWSIEKEEMIVEMNDQNEKFF